MIGIKQSRLGYVHGLEDGSKGRAFNYNKPKSCNKILNYDESYADGYKKGIQYLMEKHGELKVMDCQNETPPQLDELAAASVLDRAKTIVTGGRQTTHGRPERSFEHIAARWSLTLGVTVTPFQVALMMADMKQVRALEGVTQGAGEDHLVDMAGYVALAAELRK